MFQDILAFPTQNSNTINNCSSMSKSARILLKRLKKNNSNFKHNLPMFQSPKLK